MTEQSQLKPQPIHIMDLLGMDKDHDEDSNSNFAEAFKLSAEQRYPLSFHPADSNEFEDEQEEEMIKIVNPNKHVHNEQDGGRKRKLRHVSKIESFRRGKDAIKSFCKDLFSVKQNAEPSPEKEADE